MTTERRAGSDGQKAWWLRAVLVLQSPRQVFLALRADSDAAAEDRQEPATALVFLASIAAVLAAPRFGSLLDDPARDGLIIALIAVAAGGIYAFVGYWLIGAALTIGVRGAGGTGRARRCRHVLAFAVAPLALSLVLWPIRLAIYGSDVFRSGGADTGAGGRFFVWAIVFFAAWSFALVVYGLRTVERWSWYRALGASALALCLVALTLAIWLVLAG